MGRAAGFCVLAVATPYFTVRYAVNQATTGVAADEIETGSAAIRRVLADATYPAALRDRLFQEAVTHTGLVVVLLPADERLPTAEPGTYRHVTPLGIDTVLELTVHRVALEHRHRATKSVWSVSATDLNPSLPLVVTARTRVVKTADGTELYAYTREWTGRVASFTEWAANDAEQLREALGQLLPDIARDVVAQVFGVSIPPASASEAPATPNPNQELEPEAPPSPSEAKSPSQD
jgi:hypothetical protein